MLFEQRGRHLAARVGHAFQPIRCGSVVEDCDRVLEGGGAMSRFRWASPLDRADLVVERIDLLFV